MSTYKYYFGDGYVQFYPGSSRSPQYYFYSKDHLGNVRSVVTKNPSISEITEIQQTHYYPFGGIIADLSSGTSVQNKLYNGKELDTSNNLWWYDYGARQYDPTAPRFTTPNPLAEKYYPWNYFTYCMNNPVRYIDPDGRTIEDNDGLIGNLVNYIEMTLGSNPSEEISKALNNTLDIIDQLKKSDVIYSFNEIEIGGITETGYESENRIFSNIEKDALGLTGHELIHCYQLETGKLSFSKDGSVGKLYDLTDEKEAYQIQDVIESSMYKDSYSNKEIVKRGKNYNIDYKKIPTENLDYNSFSQEELENDIYHRP